MKTRSHHHGTSISRSHSGAARRPPTQQMRQPAKTLARMAQELELPTQQQDQGEPLPSAPAGPQRPRFKRLTTGKNPGNLRRKSLSFISPLERNPTLRRDRLEERGNAGWSDARGLDARDVDGNQDGNQDGVAADTSGEEDVGDVRDIAPGKFVASGWASGSGKSSTMPGFRDRLNTGRRKKYEDGIKLVELRSGEKYVETMEVKKRLRKENGQHMYKFCESVPESLVQFADEINKVDRITPNEELVLGQKTQAAIKLQKVYDGLVDKLQREPTDEEWCAASGKVSMLAIAQTIEEGLQAKNKLVTSNLRIVQSVVNVYLRNGLGHQYNAGDLMQEGIMVCIAPHAFAGRCIPRSCSLFSLRLYVSPLPLNLFQALIRAAEKFDPSRGFRFSTYAMYWIRAAIKSDQLYQSRVIQVPQRIQETYKKVVRVRKEFISSFERPPNKHELCDAVGLPEAHLDRCLTAMQRKTLSLDQWLVNPMKPFQIATEKDTLYSVVESKIDQRTPAESMEYSLLREDLIEAIRRHLPEEEANLLLLRYGIIDDDVPHVKNGLRSLAEVSRSSGLRPDKVRRSLLRSLNHLQSVIGDELRLYERELSLK
jgi:RNA polymerase primary sigma factor